MRQNNKKGNKEKGEIKTVITVYKKMLPIAIHKYPLFLVFEILKTVLEFVNPFILVLFSPYLIDELIGGRDLGLIVRYLAIILGGEFLLNLCISLLNAKLSMYQNRLDDYFQILLGKHIMRFDFQLTEDKKALDQLEKARNGISWYSGGVYGLADELFRFIGNIIKMIGYATIIIMYVPLLLPVIVVYVIVQAVITKKNNDIEIQTYSHLSLMDRLFKYFGFNVCDFQYGKDIRLYDAKKMMVERWKKNTNETVGVWRGQACKQLPYLIFRDILSIIRSLITYLYVGLKLIKNEISVGVFTQLITAAGGLDNALGSCVFNVQEIVKKSNYAYEFVLFMEYPEALKKGNKPISSGQHVIEFDHVSFTYPGADKPTLTDVSITIKSNEHLSVVGLNGAGKTTFVKLLCRLYDPTSGTIKMDGVDIKEYDYIEYLKQFAPVFQDFKLFAFGIDDNICLDEKDPEELDRVVKQVGLEHFMQGLPQKESTVVFKYFSEDGVIPSGGEQQKIAIARALYKKAPIMILDEPTSALDPLAESEIYTKFHDVVEDKMAFFISHRMSSCRFCDNIAVFSEGVIKEYGPHDALVKIPDGLYARMFETQAKYYQNA